MQCDEHIRYGSATDKCSVFYFLILRGEIRTKRNIAHGAEKNQTFSVPYETVVGWIASGRGVICSRGLADKEKGGQDRWAL